MFSRHEFGDKIYAPQHLQEKKSAPAEESAQCDGMQCMLLNSARVSACKKSTERLAARARVRLESPSFIRYTRVQQRSHKRTR